MSSIGSFTDIVAGRARIVVTADDALLAKKLNKIGSRFRDFGEKLRGIGYRVGGAGASIFTPIAGAAEAYAEHGSALSAGSKETGESVEALSLQQYAAQQTEVSFDDLTLAIARMNKNLGTTAAQKIFTEAMAQMGMSAVEVLKMAPDQRFEAIAAAISKIPDPARQAAVGNGLFGKSFANLLPLINSNIGALEEHGRILGMQWSTEDADRAELLQRSLRDLWDGFKSISETVGSVVAPAFTKVAGVITLTLRPIMDFIRAHGQAIATITAISGLVVLIGAGLVIAGGAAAAIATVFTTLAGIVSLVLSPVMLLVTGVGLIAVGISGAFSGGAMKAFASGAREVAQVFAKLGEIISFSLGNATDMASALGLAMSDAGYFAEEAWTKAIGSVTDKMYGFLNYLYGESPTDKPFAMSQDQIDQIERERKSYEDLIKRGFKSSGQKSASQQLEELESELGARVNDLGNSPAGSNKIFGQFGGQNASQIAGGGNPAAETAKNTKQTSALLQKLLEQVQRIGLDKFLGLNFG